MKNAQRFFANESGLELSEYAIGAALLALAVVIAFTALGGSITGALLSLADILNNALS